MITNAEFAGCAAASLDLVFGLHSCDAKMTNDGKELPGDSKPVASLQFSGDYAGHLILCVPSDQVDRLVQTILLRYGLAPSMDGPTIFAEMINIYAANLATELSRYHLQISISPPNRLWAAYPDEPSAQRIVTVEMKTEEALSFVFRYYVQAGNGMKC